MTKTNAGYVDVFEPAQPEPWTLREQFTGQVQGFTCWMTIPFQIIRKDEDSEPELSGGERLTHIVMCILFLEWLSCVRP